jgi:hypothetical protein
MQVHIGMMQSLPIGAALLSGTVALSLNAGAQCEARRYGIYEKLGRCGSQGRTALEGDHFGLGHGKAS